jgi:uncharacterized glyoxalase superfamily protein PhnB
MAATVVPYLSYRDAPAALRFLQEAFGAAILVRWDGPDGAVQHAEIRFGNGVVMMGSADHPELPLQEASVGQGIYIVVDDVDAHFARARAAGARVVISPEDTNWGTRRCRVLDPEGYEWSFGSYWPGSAAG